MNKKQITVFTGCVLDGSRVLLLQRFEPELPEADRKWEFPGGKVEFAERAAEVVKREVKEETGILVEPLELIPYVHTNIWRYEHVVLHVIVMCYVCKPVAERQRILRKKDEARRVLWVDIGSIDLTTLLPGIREFLSWVAREKFHLVQAPLNRTRRVYLECVEPLKNMDKMYYVADEQPTILRAGTQLGLFSEHEHTSSSSAPTPFVVTRSWGRRGHAPRSTVEEYYSQRAALKRFSEILRERRARGYRIVESTIGNDFDSVLERLECEMAALEQSQCES